MPILLTSQPTRSRPNYVIEVDKFRSWSNNAATATTNIGCYKLGYTLKPYNSKYTKWSLMLYRMLHQTWRRCSPLQMWDVAMLLCFIEYSSIEHTCSVYRCPRMHTTHLDYSCPPPAEARPHRRPMEQFILTFLLFHVHFHFYQANLWDTFSFSPRFWANIRKNKHPSKWQIF